MHVLLTGAGGFVGHHVLDHLLTTTDWNLTLTDSFRHHGYTDRIREVLESRRDQAYRVRVITHDLTVPWSSVGIRNLIEGFGPVEAIFNVASESHVDRSIIEPVPFVRNNVDLMLNMLELARIVQPQIFIQLSTDEVYGPASARKNFSEWSSIVPSNPYSASKAAQEAIAISYWRTYSVPVVIVNCMNIIGERQHPEKFVPKVIAAVIAGETVQIHASPAGVVGSRFYLHARNLADALVFIARQGKPWLYYGEGSPRVPDRYNVVGELEVDNLTLAKQIAEFAGKKLWHELSNFHASRPGHDLRYALDGTKLTRLGWKPPIPFWESLHKTVWWSIDHPQWLTLAGATRAAA